MLLHLGLHGLLSLSSVKHIKHTCIDEHKMAFEKDLFQHICVALWFSNYSGHIKHLQSISPTVSNVNVCAS